MTTISPELLPFQEAIDFFKGKIKLPSASWTSIWQEQHAHGFVVAGATQDEILTSFHNFFSTMREKGQSYADFRRVFDDAVKRTGWAHNGSAGWRSRIIYDTNVAQSYNAGRYKQMMAVKDFRPFWRYRHTPSEHPRLHHLAWDGLILPADDAWWDTHMPQNGWRCKCRVDSLTRSEAQAEWEKSGKNGPDSPPPIEWETVTVGKTGANPRTVRVPKGIDPGFAYNPGKAWLEPHTVPPLTGYDAVLKERSAAWPTGFIPPAAPSASKVAANDVLTGEMTPQRALSQMDDFLAEFGATRDTEVVVHDPATFPDGAALAITQKLFQDGSGQWKWENRPDEVERMRYTTLLAKTILEPDEVWINWEQDRGAKGNWRLKRRLIRVFEIEGNPETAFSAFEWSGAGWIGSTTFLVDNGSLERRAQYLNKLRIGQLLFKRTK